MTNTDESLTIGQLFDKSSYSKHRSNEIRLKNFLSCFELSLDSSINYIKK